MHRLVPRHPTLPIAFAAATLSVIVLIAVLEIQESATGAELLVFLLPALAGGFLIGRWRAALIALAAVVCFAVLKQPSSSGPAVLALVGGLVLSVSARKWLTSRSAPPPRQVSWLALRVYQSDRLYGLVRRLISGRPVDTFLDGLRLRLDTFPGGLYQPAPWLPMLTANRAEGCESRWQAMHPLVHSLGVDSALDIGANEGFFSIQLGSLGVPTLAVESERPIVRTALLAVERSGVEGVGVLALELAPDTLRILPSTDCTLCLSLWHHLVRVHGLEVATGMLEGIWERTAKVMFFDTGEAEMPASFNLPDMAPDARAWLAGYLRDTCEGSRPEHLGLHAAFDADGEPCLRNLFAVIREGSDRVGRASPGA